MRLSYHGLRAKDKTFNADFKTDFDPTLPKVEVIPQDIGRVLLNLINNAFHACTERLALSKAEVSRSAVSEKNLAVETQRIASLPEYKPTVTVSTKNLGDRIEISVKDNGPGIPDEIKDKILQPFFTTKKGTEGTGLGLSITHDIVKAHGGELKVETKTARAGSDGEGAGSTFVIQIPIKNNEL